MKKKEKRKKFSQNLSATNSNSKIDPGQKSPEGK